MALKAIEVYQGSDGDMTKTFYAELEKRGPIWVVAVNLFRAQKCSVRAKVYRGGIRGKGRFRDMAYDKKNWSMENLCRILGEHAGRLSINYGWKLDPSQAFHSWVLYVDLPSGQVSFHSATRFAGPDYSSDWDQQRRSAERIIEFCDSVALLAAEPDDFDSTPAAKCIEPDPNYRIPGPPRTDFSLPEDRPGKLPWDD